MKVPKYSIIPKPQKYEVLEGSYTVTSETAVLCNPEFLKAGNYLSQFLQTKKDAQNGAILTFPVNLFIIISLHLLSNDFTRSSNLSTISAMALVLSLELPFLNPLTNFINLGSLAVS